MVYAVQRQLAYDAGSGGLKPKFDLSSAEEFGQIAYVLGSNAAPWSDGIVAEAELGLKDYASGRDHLLLIGNPVLIAVVSAIAARRGPVLKFLQWSGKERRYLPIEVNLLPGEDSAWNR